MLFRSILLLQGESVTLKANVLDGYEFNNTVWSVDNIHQSSITIKDAKKEETTLTVAFDLPMAFEFDVIASSKDSNPTIANYRASINDALNEVTLEATIADTKGLAAYAFTTSNIKPASDYSGWIPVEGKTQEVSAITKQSGTYYLWVKDDADNIVSSSVLYIYEITFSPGEGEGIMPTILKVQNIDVVLPTVTFMVKLHVFWIFEVKIS